MEVPRVSGSIGFHARYSRDTVLSSAENFVLYLLLEAKPSGGNGVRLPLNLGIVLDRSGSMYDEKRLDYVSEAVKYILDHLGPEDSAAVVAFADKAAVVAMAISVLPAPVGSCTTPRPALMTSLTVRS